VFEEAVGTNLSEMLYRSEHGTEQFGVAFLTPKSFRFLGVPALIGRTITEEDTKAGASPVAVLSHIASMTYFGGDPAVLGRKIVLDDRPMSIVGVYTAGRPVSGGSVSSVDLTATVTVSFF
jgi:hypothetical protein